MPGRSFRAGSTEKERRGRSKLVQVEYAARRAELRRAARARERQAAAPSQDEAEESDATPEEEATRLKGEHDEKGATARWHEG